MATLNYKHLRYFWQVARSGSIARAAEDLHLAPNSISSQLSEFEAAIGVKLFRRVGRGLEMTDAGRRVFVYAEEIFAVGDELMRAVLNEDSLRTESLRIGVADSVSKSMSFRLIKPLLDLAEPLRLSFREGQLSRLLADLSIHQLDLIITDRSIPHNLNVRCYAHMLGESGISMFGTKRLAAKYCKNFPNHLNGAPILLPGEDVAIRPQLMHWMQANAIRPRIIGEFDDSALMKTFGRGGAGLFFAPSAIATEICAQYGVVEAGNIAGISEQIYVVTTERKISHPAVVLIHNTARDSLRGC
jgi:LysR family transcriptional activator of nhaA